MPKSVAEIPLPRDHLGAARRLTVHRYGDPGARPKVYIQAGLHANEIPPLLVAHRLIGLLDDASERGSIRGEIVVVPACNPIGFGQVALGELLGRFALDGSGNFNRDFPDLTDAVAEAVEDRLGPDPQENVALIRDALVTAAREACPGGPVDALRRTLLALAIDADIVLDLHCDSESLVHLYTGTPLWPAAADLAAQVGARVVLLAERSGGDPFDEACSGVWWKLARRFGARHPVPPACLAGTIEYRGRADVSAELAASDAENLLRFLQRRGVVAGQPGPVPPLRRDAYPLAGVERLEAPMAGVVAYRKAVGDLVRAGEVVAEVIEPGGSSVPVRATAGGVLFSRLLLKLVAPGAVIASLAGPEPLPGRKDRLLEN